VWPLNPKGELLIGLKLEDKYALENAEANARVPGIGFAEWGPGDMAFSLGVRNESGPLPAALQAARAKVFAAVRSNKLFFLNAVTPDNVVDMIKEGVMIGAANERAAEVGRKYTKRTMPW
jgi:4-hydroxy-2-oxoheptanedioate aldolase